MCVLDIGRIQFSECDHGHLYNTCVTIIYFILKSDLDMFLVNTVTVTAKSVNKQITLKVWEKKAETNRTE